jgi:hypothetical protein
MESKVPYLNITDKQYKLIGITWGFIFTAFFHYYHTFDKVQYSIVKTFLSGDFALKAVLGMLTGYIVSYYILRYINK